MQIIATKVMQSVILDIKQTQIDCRPEDAFNKKIKETFK